MTELTTCPHCGSTLLTGDDRIIDRAIIVIDPNGQYRVKAKASNGETILTSEQYRSLDWARTVAGDLHVPIIEGEHNE